MDFFVGTYTVLGGPGIVRCRLADDRLAMLSTASELVDPTYVILSRDKRHLFAVGALVGAGEGMVASYQVGKEALTKITEWPTGGNAACHLALDPEERFLYVANYVSGSISMFPATNGLLGPCGQLITHEGHGPNAARQEKAHAHHVAFRPGTRELFVCDLGMDAVVVYEQEPKMGGLSPIGPIPVEAGLGPRHLVFDGQNRFYLACELGNAVCVYEWQGQGWECVQTLSTLPPGWTGENTVAAIQLRDRRVYVSNRGHDSIAQYLAGVDGMLTPLAIQPVEGRTPRDFRVMDDGILVACQDGGGILWTREGRTVASLPIAGAVCISESVNGGREER